MATEVCTDGEIVSKNANVKNDVRCKVISSPIILLLVLIKYTTTTVVFLT